jgi:hypothetical protein
LSVSVVEFLQLLSIDKKPIIKSGRNFNLIILILNF